MDAMSSGGKPIMPIKCQGDAGYTLPDLHNCLSSYGWIIIRFIYTFTLFSTEALIRFEMKFNIEFRSKD